jgi:phosphoglucomutase
MPIDESILRRAKVWMDGDFDAETRKQVRELAESDPAELTDSFYRDLEFGTGGLRGIMGAGTNRMNKYTVGMATQGLANYLKMMFSDLSPIRVAISYDSRNNSKYFARVTAEVFAANDFTVYLFDSLRPTPELSFAIRYLGCQSGVMITASHNPKEYNGYKAYWDDGAQMIAPHDENVISEVQKITSIGQVRWDGKSENIQIIGKDIDEAYIMDVMKLRLSPEVISRQRSLGIVYTPLHGTGIALVPEVLRRYGFSNVTVVKEQAVADGNFPTLRSPNPEERDALTMAIQKAEEVGAALVMATDPDADRVGIAVRDNNREMVLLNGNQTAAILLYYILTRWKELRKFKGKEFVVSTIVTSAILGDITRSFGVDFYECLTGFKYIADVIRRNEGKAQFIAGGEESYGYLVGDFVRDKDAVSACAMIAEASAWMADKGKTLFDLLLEIYNKYAFYKEGLHSVTKKGKAGAEEIAAMMVNFRANPPQTINNSRVVMIKDYLERVETDVKTGTKSPIDLPVSNVLQFITADGSRISVRPSGTEPKIKFYIGVMEALHGVSAYQATNARLDRKIEGIISSMNLQ